MRVQTEGECLSESKVSREQQAGGIACDEKYQVNSTECKEATLSWLA